MNSMRPRPYAAILLPEIFFQAGHRSDRQPLAAGLPLGCDSYVEAVASRVLPHARDNIWRRSARLRDALEFLETVESEKLLETSARVVRSFAKARETRRQIDSSAKFAEKGLMVGVELSVEAAIVAEPCSAAC